MEDDPLCPARMRFPMAAATVEHSDELPSRTRPFGMRGSRTITPKQAHHRTPSHATVIPQKTHRDNAVDDDSYTVPDD